jgi:hypothetical protein
LNARNVRSINIALSRVPDPGAASMLLLSCLCYVGGFGCAVRNRQQYASTEDQTAEKSKQLIHPVAALLRAYDCEGWEFDGDFNPAGVQ